MIPQSKIYRKDSPLDELNFENLVFTNGCFDILHPGHLDYLYRASKLGGPLVVGLNSDASVKRIKGMTRPINDFQFRSTMLAFYSFIDAIIEFEEDTPIRLLKKLKPYILVKGGDYKKEEIVGYDLVQSYGGEVIILDFVPGNSSSTIIDKIKML